MEMGSQLVLLFFQILDRFVLLFQGFVRRKDVRGVELQSESVLPARKDLLLLLFSGSTGVFALEFSGLCEMHEIFRPIAGSYQRL